MFLETMVLYPPVLYVAGFVNADRGMFRSVSNITKVLECCKKQVRLNLLRKIYRANLRRKMCASSTRWISILQWNFHLYFCQSAFINGRSETRSIGYFRLLFQRLLS
jgi:hypothetical protein